MSRLAHILLPGMLLWIACASSAGNRGAAATYREMREAEAEVERNAAALASAPGEGTRSAHVDDLCGAARRICELAQHLEEADARARCEAAMRRCQELGGSAGAEAP